MGKFILTNQGGDIKIKIPRELLFLISNSKSRWFKNLLTYNPNTKVFRVIISDMDYWEFRNLNVFSLNEYGSSARDRRKSHILTNGFSTTYIKNPNRTFSGDMHDISFFVKKDKGVTLCDELQLDYTIYQDDEGKLLITASIELSQVTINSNSYQIRDSMSTLYTNIYNITNTINKHTFLSAIKDVGEIFFYKYMDGNNIVYVTKDKYAYAMCNGGNVASANIARSMSIGKFFKDHFPFISEATVNAYIQYNKMLTAYDPSLFSIVSGNDIKKYYLYDSYFKQTGELGNSCMRHYDKEHVINFYAKNSNFKLLIIKAGETDTIMGRALLITTTEGEVIMDRIYTVDTKVINLFHTYAKDNGIKNIYQYRGPCGKERNLMTMGPINWTKVYTKNFIVDLDWLPNPFKLLNNAEQYKLCLFQHSNISSSYDIPYIDNFQYINPFTMQASVNPLNFFTNCYLSDQPIANDCVYYYNGEVYDSRFVNTCGTKAPTLKPDVVTLDDTDTKGADTDIDKEDDEEEFPEWIEEDDEEWEVEEEEVQPDFTITAQGVGIGGIISGNTPNTPESTTNLTTALYDGLITNNLRYRGTTTNRTGLITSEAQAIMQMIEDLAIDNSRPEQNLF